MFHCFHFATEIRNKLKSKHIVTEAEAMRQVCCPGKRLADVRKSAITSLLWLRAGLKQKNNHNNAPTPTYPATITLVTSTRTSIVHNHTHLHRHPQPHPHPHMNRWSLTSYRHGGLFKQVFLEMWHPTPFEGAAWLKRAYVGTYSGLYLRAGGHMHGQQHPTTLTRPTEHTHIAPGPN